MLNLLGSEHYETLARLQTDLFRNYSRNIIPQRHKNAPVNISFDIALNQIIDLVSLDITDDKLKNLFPFTIPCMRVTG